MVFHFYIHSLNLCDLTAGTKLCIFSYTWREFSLRFLSPLSQHQPGQGEQKYCQEKREWSHFRKFWQVKNSKNWSQILKSCFKRWEFIPKMETLFQKLSLKLLNWWDLHLLKCNNFSPRCCPPYKATSLTEFNGKFHQPHALFIIIASLSSGLSCADKQHQKKSCPSIIVACQKKEVNGILEPCI